MIPPVLQPPTIAHIERGRRWSSAWRVLPDFLILGAQKAGTTSLHAYLSEHPQVAPGLVKEIHFFDYNFQRGVGWYRAHFPTIAERWQGKFRVTGEGSPYYLFHPRAPARAAQVVPHAKLLVLLRNPVDRAYSHYYHQVRLGLEAVTFDAALEQEPARLVGEFEQLLTDDEYYSFNYQNYSYLARGMYADQLERWLRYFPRKQFLILQSERFYADPARALRQVTEFLGLPEWSPAGFEIKNDGSYPPLDPARRAELVEFFAPHNARLFELLNETFDWS